MPSKTNFGDLTLYASSGEDAEETFLKFRTDIAGITPDSNFNKIANILASHDFSIENTKKIFDVTANKISENYYESNDFEVNKYYPHMLIILSVLETNTGDVTININSLGNIPVKKFDTFEVLEKMKTVDGSGSGLDADLLDGKESTDFATAEQRIKSDTTIQSIKGNGTLIIPDENRCVNIISENIGVVPITRTINNKDLSQDVILSANYVGASTFSHSHSDATTSSSGFMSSNDKSKLDEIA